MLAMQFSYEKYMVRVAGRRLTISTCPSKDLVGDSGSKVRRFTRLQELVHQIGDLIIYTPLAIWQVASEALLESERCWYDPADAWQRKSVCSGYAGGNKCSCLRSQRSSSWRHRVDSKRRANDALGAVKCEARSDSAESTDMVEAALGGRWDV